MYQVISSVASIFLGLLGFIVLIQDTIFDKFFRWLHLGGVFDFVLANYHYFAPVLCVFVAMRWVKNWKILAILGVLFFAFFYFVVKK